jgi:FkbM family methyltransferase
MIVDFARHPRIHQVLAFEPSTLCCAIIERNCELNGLRHVTVVNAAVGESTGRGVMPRNSHCQCSTAVSDEATANAQDRFEEVRITTLDDEISDSSGLWITLIDVEGGELKVLRGGRKFIRRLSPLIIFEYHEITRTHFLLDDVRSELGENYEIFRLRSDGLLDSDLFRTWNCVAVSCESPFYAIAKSLMVDASGISAPSYETAIGKGEEYR